MATQSVATKQENERLSLNSSHWLEQIWEQSDFPAPIWRRLRKIDAAARAASQIAQILAVDRENQGLADGGDHEYEPLDSHIAGGLGDAILVLTEDVCEGLEELRDWPSTYKQTMTTQSAQERAA